MKKAFSILMIAGLFLFFGCNDIRDVAETEKTAVAAGTTLADEASAHIRFAKPVVKSDSRTALPEFTDESLDSFAFALKGGLVTATAQEVLGSYEGLEGLANASLACAEGEWNFVLTASKDGTVFTGSLEDVTITSGDNELSFELTWDKSALEGKGSLEFNLDYGLAKNASDVKLVTAELLSYDVATASESAIEEYAESPLVPENNEVTFAASELDAGNYRVKIHLYADTEKKHLINTWRELAIITGGQESIASRAFESLNKVYKISYELKNGTESEDAPLPTCFTRHSGDVLLPAPERGGFSFSGWYSNSDYLGEKIEKISAGDLGDKTFYAKWSKAAITVSIGQLNDLGLTYEVDGKSVVFTAKSPAASGTTGASFVWSVDGIQQSASGDTFTFDASTLASATYEIEVVSGDLSSMAAVFVNGADSCLYVSANGADSNDGSETSPLATIAAAVEKMNNPDIDYTIYIDGMLGRSEDSNNLASGQLIAEFQPIVEESAYRYRYKAPILAKSITLMGLNPLNANGEPVDGINPTFGIDTNGKSTPVLLVATSVPVTLENIKLTGGFLKSGEALMVGGTYRDENDEGIDVTANVTIKDGVLITGNNIWQGTTSIYNTPVRVGTGCGLKMEGGKITGNVTGLGVVSVARNATFEMTGGYIGGNHLYPYFDYETSESYQRVTCGVSVVAPAEDSSMAGGLFKISGDAVVDEIYLKTGAVVTLAGALTSDTKIQIEPEAYTEGLKVIDIAENAGLSLEEACDYLTVKEKEGAYWQILEDGTLFEGYLTSTSGLGSLLSSLSANTAETPYKVSVSDSTTNFDSLLTSVNSALSSSGKYVWLSFKDSAFTKIEGEFSEYVTCLTIPESVTSLGFIDGEGIQRFKVASANENFAVSGTVLCSKDLNTLYRWPPASPATVGTIAVNIHSIADGAFANCRNIKEFNVLEGNSYFKVTTGDITDNSSAYSAYQSVFYFVYDADIPTAPDSSEDFEAWLTWDKTYSYRVRNQYRNGYVPIPVLTSYDGKTLVAVPPALELLTVADVKEKSGGYEKDQGGTDINYTASSGISLDFDTVRPYALCGIKNVQEITLGVTATSLPAYTFKDCSALKYVYLSIAGSTIKPYTFSDCTALQGVNFQSETITTVQSNAFDGCTGLERLYFQAGENTGRSGTASDAYPASCTVTISGYVA